DVPLREYLDQARHQVDDALDRCLPKVDAGRGTATPARLAAAMRYSVLGGGKRLRPVLCLMATEACGGDSGAAMGAACALELVHTYSLIHDDLPAMDNDDLRRGRATCHKAFDEATAILAGDALLTLAFELIAHEVEQQALDERIDGSLCELEAIHRRKTGALLRAPLQMGAVIAHAPQAHQEALDHYGRAVGLAFQIVDDLLDVQGDETKLGKRVGKDSGLGKWTYPRFLGIDGSRRRAQQLADEAVAALAPLGSRGHRLRELALALLERDR